jgi:diadenosine tetraphosphatase ApaH/serine/threonine PP2A family protein phosphatase
VIRGNHDKVAAGVESAEGFNQAARHAALWTLDQLTEPNKQYLTSLPVGPVVIDDLIEICHGSPDDEDEYIFEHVDAIEALRASSQQVCFFGHTHVAVVYWLSLNDFDVILASPQESETTIPIQGDRRYLINPGSVGQPRDGDPRAAYATFDSDAQKVVLYRVGYDVTGAQQRIASVGLPEGLARRLALGK